MSVVVKDAVNLLVHVPDFVQYGSKPSRDIADDSEVLQKIKKHLRTYQAAISYPPHQVFIGNQFPDELNGIPRPWYESLLENASRKGKFGEIVPEEEFYAWLKLADDFDLFYIEKAFAEEIAELVAAHPFINELRYKKIVQGKPLAQIEEIVARGQASPVYHKGDMIGAIRQDHDRDDTLKAQILMENLLAKSSGSMAVLHLIDRSGIDPRQIDFVLDCTETAVGDRYNRGGGSLSKAMAEMCGCINASGFDARAFCCAPNHAIISAACMVEAGIFENVIVAGGGCLAKLGMKYFAHLRQDMPILEDVLGAVAFLITRDDGLSPVIRLDVLGKHDVGSGSAQQAIMTSLILKPLEKTGMKMTDIDKFSTEMHNPEITLPAGSGDTPSTNYRIMAALAALDNQIQKEDIQDFIRKHGMPGFSPTQGHIPSSVPFLGHAIEAMKAGSMKRAMFVAKGSLFLGRMTQLSDGISFLLEANPQETG